jgi:DNA polymerase-3 subunit chi
MADRVDFYVLASNEPRKRLIYACRLAEKAYLRNLRVTLLTDAGAEAAVLDDLLWTFADGSFVPHSRGPRDEATPVQIADRHADASPADLLINLGTDMPPDLGQYGRIAEIIDADDSRKRFGRDRFRRYREQALQPETHNVGDG